MQDAVVKVFARRRVIPNAKAGEAYVDLSSPCGVSVPSSMDVYVLQEALIADGTFAPPVRAVALFRLGPVDIAPPPSATTAAPADT